MPGSPFKLNPLRRRENEGTTSLHATYADGYYSELKVSIRKSLWPGSLRITHYPHIVPQSKGFVAKKRKADNLLSESDTLEIDEGYAVCGLGEGSANPVSFARPKRPLKWRKVSGSSLPPEFTSRRANDASKAWPDAHDSRGVIEFARKLTMREEQTSRRLTLSEEVAAWKALRKNVRVRRAITNNRTTA
ncbi:hypothetical protein NMY22_g11581 [Coprinellus aureogranulatus]|nr:hypothetical protein NMY22_g11581 [Coprinellus aureogranulatus]